MFQGTSSRSQTSVSTFIHDSPALPAMLSGLMQVLQLCQQPVTGKLRWSAVCPQADFPGGQHPAGCCPRDPNPAPTPAAS